VVVGDGRRVGDKFVDGELVVGRKEVVDGGEGKLIRTRADRAWRNKSMLTFGYENRAKP
jgi:hypothetical protein